MRIRRPSPAQAGRQSTWIAAMEPWCSLGYEAASLGRYLRRMAGADRVLVAEDRGEVVGILVFQPDFLLGTFIALLAVPAQAAGRGIGRSLIERVERTALRRKRWLWVSCDGDNRAAARFYARLGFLRVARLSDLIRDGRTEILWRRARATCE
jgi:ribosomal protein S18 acetylase RimI-like enzyme